MIKLIDEYGGVHCGYLKRAADNLWEFDPKYLGPEDRLKEPCTIDRDGLKDWLEKFEMFLSEKNTDQDKWVDLKFVKNTGDIQFNCSYFENRRRPDCSWFVSYKIRNGAAHFWPHSPDFPDDHPINRLDGFHGASTITSEKHIREYMAEIQAEIEGN